MQTPILDKDRPGQRPPERTWGQTKSDITPQVSVILFSGGWGGSHVTITRDAFDLTIQAPPSTGTPSPAFLVVTSGGQDWRPV